MRYRRAGVVERALDLLDAQGLDALSMRKLATDLGVQPGALYHHFTSKDELLAAIADELLDRGHRATEIVTWEAELRLVSVELRDAMLACRDGAALVARVHALGLGASGPEGRMHDALTRAGADAHLARVGARTLLHFVFGHVADEQLAHREGADFQLGLTLLLEGLGRQLDG